MTMAASSTSVASTTPDWSDSDTGDGYQSDREQSSSSSGLPKRKKQRISHSKTKFNPEWTKKHPCIVKNVDDPEKVYCTVCCKSLSTSHQGYRDIDRHINGQVHQSRTKQLESNRRITDCFVSDRDTIALKVIGAEVKFTGFLLEHNLPIAVSDHAGPLFKSMFPDSKIAQYYGCARTKTTCILNRALGPEFAKTVFQLVQQQPFTLSLNGSNDKEEQKLVPLTVRVFDNDLGMVKSKFLSMCLCNEGTAATYFEKVEEVFVSHDIPWSNCIALSVDSTSVNIGRHNSIKSRLEVKNPSVYTLGCPCHFVHNAAHKASKMLEGATGFDVEELAVDVYYYFDRSTKRKGELQEYACFCDVAYHKVLKYVSTRWLSLQTSIERILRQYVVLHSYFLSQDDETSDNRLCRLQALFSSPMTEVYLMFYQSSLPIFTKINLLLQRDSPCIHILRDVMESLLKKLLGRFVTVAAMDEVDSVTDVLFTDISNQLADDEIMIGFVTKQTLLKLKDEVEPHEIRKFYAGVREFFVGAAAYITHKFLWGDPVLEHSCFVDFQKRKKVSFQSVEYFLSRFPEHCPPADRTDELYDEYRVYQCLPEIPKQLEIKCE